MKSKIMLKSFLFLATFVLVFYPISALAVTNLSDIDNSYAKDAIKELLDKGIINGKSDGRFDPSGKITRQDFAIILAKALKLDVSNSPSQSSFSDVGAGQYAFPYIEAAKKAGLINGYSNGSFGAKDNLTREQMAVLFVKALGGAPEGSKSLPLPFSDANQISSYAKDSVAYAVYNGMISGNSDGTFNPTGIAKREQVAVVTTKFLKVKEEGPKEVVIVPEPNPEPVPPVTEPEPTPPVEEPEKEEPPIYIPPRLLNAPDITVEGTDFQLLLSSNASNAQSYYNSINSIVVQVNDSPLSCGKMSGISQISSGFTMSTTDMSCSYSIENGSITIYGVQIDSELSLTIKANGYKNKSLDYVPTAPGTGEGCPPSNPNEIPDIPGDEETNYAVFYEISC